ncbi:GTP cyclohydrolase I [Franzmannia pantelleriensis]|uniref:GTP cyclohydrolase I n=1 Tax=Franzmannia pantelleriensis TaxID=48727 RepID=A0A1G9PBY4_9GAMM|nr:GTP cyclohydrolase I [Halomonas pantelleriensis]
MNRLPLEDIASAPAKRLGTLSWVGILATPHSQRSQAHLSLRLADGLDELPLLGAVERGLGTALRTAVKRIDEQAFALANGQHLMFCEECEC